MNPNLAHFDWFSLEYSEDLSPASSDLYCVSSNFSVIMTSVINSVWGVVIFALERSIILRNGFLTCNYSFYNVFNFFISIVRERLTVSIFLCAFTTVSVGTWEGCQQPPSRPPPVAWQEPREAGASSSADTFKKSCPPNASENPGLMWS